MPRFISLSLYTGSGFETFSLLAQIFPEPVFVMFQERIYPIILVFIQLSCLVFILCSAPVISKNIEGILVESAGLFLGLHAIYTMRIGNFNITPKLKQGGEFVHTGPYRIIRHPMYTAQILAVLPLVVDYFSYYRLAALLLLVADLLIKIVYEEKRLLTQFPEYENYRKQTRKLIPFLY